MCLRLSHCSDNPTGFTMVLLLVSSIACLSPAYGEDFAEEALEAPGMIHLSEAHQKLAGIATRTVHRTTYQPESRAFGKVLALDPLLQVAHQLQSAGSEQKVAAAALATAKSAYDQVQGLYQEHAVPRVKLDQARVDWLRAKSNYEQALAQADAARNGAIQNWGKVLTRWISNPGSAGFQNLLHRKSALLLISLPAGDTFPEGLDRVFVHRGADRAGARTARLISAAPVTDAHTQGESYFFRSAAEGFRSGMHLYVWIPAPGVVRKGLEIPSEALVWRDGRPWIYLKTAHDTFRRRPVEPAADQNDRWFLAEAAGDHADIVITGGQTLLSREFHWQIPEEDED